MKVQTILTALSFFVLCSCASSYNQYTDKTAYDKTEDNGYSTESSENSLASGNVVRPNAERKSNLSLGDMISRVAGVQALGNGRFKIRGAESIYSGTDPLFVLNGTPVGSDYASLVNLVDPNAVSSIRALKGPDASIYGSRGANGVIVIKTRKL